MASEPRPVDWDLHAYRPGDEAEILELFNTSFGARRSPEHWRWKFLQNPYGGPHVTLARRRADGLVVGTHVLMPFRLNALGRPVLAGHSLDLVVREGYRGQGIFDRAGTDCIARFRAQGGEAVVAFPNADSYPGFVRSLGWNRLLFPRLWSMPLDLGSTLARAGAGPLGPVLAAPFTAATSARLAWRRFLERRESPRGAVFESATAVPADHDELWNACRSLEVLSLWKDSEYLRWRYAEHPDHEFAFVALREGGRLLALGVTVDVGGACILCELVTRQRRVGTARALVSHVAHAALGRGCRALQFFGSDAGFFDEVFRGFSHRVAVDNVLVGRSLAEDELDRRMAIAGNWTVTYGDSDFV